MYKNVSQKKRSIHPYFTTQSHYLVSSYIKKYSKKNDVVLDCFVGSGVTLLESQILNRHSIGVDLSQLACLISKTSTTKIDNLDELSKIYNEIIDNTKYQIGLFSENNKDYENKYFKDLRLPKNADKNSVKELFNDKNFYYLNILINEINKIKNKKYRDLFRTIFSGILHRASKTFFYDKIKLGGGNSSIFTKYRYWIPKRLDNRDVLDLFKIRFSRIKSVIKNINSLLNEDYKPKIYNKSSTNLSFIKNSSIDYIYIDPPYGSNISYLDLSTMWYAWLFESKNFFKDKKKEVIEGGDLGKKEDEYLRLLNQTIKHLSRVLKEQRYISLAFSHKNLNFWSKISTFFSDSNLVCKKIDYYPSFYNTFHKLKSTQSVLNGQLIITFQKKTKKNKKKNNMIYISDDDIFLKNTIQSFLKKKNLKIEKIVELLVIKIFKSDKSFKNLKMSDVVQICKKNFKYLKEKNEWTINK